MTHAVFDGNKIPYILKFSSKTNLLFILMRNKIHGRESNLFLYVLKTYKIKSTFAKRQKRLGGTRTWRQKVCIF